MELERTEFVRVGTQHALMRRIVQAAEIDTVIDSRLRGLDAGLAARRPRDERHRDHEHPRRPAGGRTRRCARSSSSPRPTTTAASATIPRSSPRPCSARTRRGRGLESNIVEADIAMPRVRRAQPRRDGHHPALRRTGWGPTCGTLARARMLTLPAGPLLLGFDPRYQFVHEDDIVGVLEHAVNTTCPGSTTSPATACSCSGGREPARQAARADPAAVGDGLADAGAAGSRACASPRRWPSTALRRAWSTASSRPRAAPLRYTTREAVQRRSRRNCGCASCARATASRTATSARWRSSCATARTCAACAIHFFFVCFLTCENHCSYSCAARRGCVLLDTAAHAAPYSRPHRSPDRRPARPQQAGSTRTTGGKEGTDRRGDQGQRRRRGGDEGSG